jgi:hypothetical protein
MKMLADKVETRLPSRMKLLCIRNMKKRKIKKKRN